VLSKEIPDSSKEEISEISSLTTFFNFDPDQSQNSRELLTNLSYKLFETPARRPPLRRSDEFGDWLNYSNTF